MHLHIPQRIVARSEIWKVHECRCGARRVIRSSPHGYQPYPVGSPTKRGVWSNGPFVQPTDWSKVKPPKGHAPGS